MKPALLPILAALAIGACAKPTTVTTVAASLRGIRFSVEIANDNVGREHGLMMRDTLAVDHGMLFVFPEEAPRAFWMKNTLIPLDMLYFNTNRQLVSMQLDVPPCKIDPCPTYPSGKPARYVIELAGGTARRIGAEPGDALAIDGEIGAVR